MTRHDIDSASASSSLDECSPIHHQDLHPHHHHHPHFSHLMSNSPMNGSNNIIQYAQSQEGQFFVPVTVSTADLQTYQLRTPSHHTPNGLSQVLMTTPNTIPTSPTNQNIEDAAKKRELRLLKNREAAKECRRKKKEYIKCLEQRVSVLEDQNKALIEELKTLKTLYCQKE
ncbi:cyclic AMP-dependent transcription factor ATF-1-like [Brevipalpus obovatus]|uniref:cyclic AMP-dependent transcription factor ATF-1-like n=1 Tax=Brevipalpus obovatus TaxID=246614 RepID=UPI003D9F92C9